jgi:hypothetical protein
LAQSFDRVASPQNYKRRSNDPDSNQPSRFGQKFVRGQVDGKIALTVAAASSNRPAAIHRIEFMRVDRAS